MFICIVIFLIIPFLILGFMYYNILLDTTKDNLNDSSYELLEQMERNILSKTNRLKNKTDVLLSDRQFQELLRNTDFRARDLTAYDSFAALDEIMEQYFYDENELESIIIVSDDGGIYTYKGYVEENSLVRFVLKYGKVEEKAGVLSWFAVTPEIMAVNRGKSTLAAGLNLSDTNYQKDNKHLATMYFICNPIFFDSVDSRLSGGSEAFMICTAEGMRIYARGRESIPQLWELSLNVAQEVYSSSRCSIRVSVNEKDYILVSYTSPALGWKYIRFVQYGEYFSGVENLKYLTLGIAILLFGILCTANSLWLSRITKPVREIVTAMHKVGKRNFDISISVHSNDEFGVIARGFNSMVKEIRALFRQVIVEEEKSKEAELTALQYQINPHFLYNTLSAIRLTAIFNKQNDIAEMLSLLGNFLHNTLSNVNKVIPLEDEFKNIETYIALYQIRFNNSIIADFAVEEGLRQKRIYSMLIQPVVENAIMHGLNQKLDSNETAIINISARTEKNCMLVSVRDNGEGMTEEQIKQAMERSDQKQTRLHIGLYNIHKRIKYLYGDPYGVNIDSKVGEYTEITLTLPILDGNFQEGTLSLK